MLDMMAERIQEACLATGRKLLFKASFDKANRTSIGSLRGLGIDKGLEILSIIKKESEILRL